jgi:TrbL/VirB6 plasmid conjugal transfer protein
MARVLRRTAKVVRRTLAVPGVIIAVTGAALLGSPAIAQAAVGAPAATGQHVAAAQHAAGAQQSGTARLAVARTPATPAAPAAPSGICSAPGIGDIGGLLGFCNAGSSGLIGDLNNICQPSVPAPEPAAGGIDSLIRPPVTGGKPPPTLYESYGMAGQSWAAYDMQCSDMTSLIGNSVAGMVFDASKALDRVTITVYQSAAGEGILSWLTNAVNRLITSLGNAIYFPFLAPVVILGAIWLAWQGLIRKRATRTIEGTIWMVIACAAAIWLIGRPADFTGLGKTVSNGITQTLNVAFAGLPAPAGSNCVPVQGHDPQVKAANYNFTGGSGVVDQNANELWTVLVCKPWLDGEFGTTVYTTGKGAKPTVVNQYGRQLLWSQAIATNEKPTASLIQAKQDAYAGIAQSIKQNNPDVYSLFQGNQYPTRLEIAFAALFAALVAGVLVLLIAITLIILKLGFLLLLVAGPFFLIVGTHPGFGRVVALRWVEMLVGVLLKQAAVALVLSILLYAYSLIMGTSDAVLPWALKILMIALVTVAVFIYRKPFVHLFSAVGYGMVGSRDRAEAGLAQAGSLARRNTLDAATVGVPGFAAYRAARWARRNPAQAAGLAAQVATAGGAGAAAAGASAASAATVGSQDGAEQPGAPGGESSDEAYQGGSGRSGMAARGRGRAAAPADGSARAAPPLDLPDRDAAGQPRSPSGWARSGAADAATGRARPDAPGGQRAGASSGAAPSGGAPAGGAPAGRASGAPASAPAGGGSAPARPGAARQRWPGVAPRPPAAAPPPSGGSPGPGPGAAPPTFGSAPSRGGAPARSGTPARGSGPARSTPPRGGDPGSSTPGPATPRSSSQGGGSGFWGSPSRSSSPGRRPSRNAAPPLRGRSGGSGGGTAGGAGRSAAPPSGGGPAGGGPAGGDQAGGGQAGPGADPGPPGPFWLRPVRRKK